MRRFKLLKDLPGFSAGTIMYIDEDEDSNAHKLYVESIDVFAGYKVYDMLIMTNEGIGADVISNWLEELPEEKKRWRAEIEATYFYVNSDAEVRYSFEDYGPVDYDRYAIGNYFQTKEEAQALADYLKALAVVRDDAKGFVPDWSNNKQSKFYVYYSHRKKCFCADDLGEDEDNGVFGLPYFAESEDAEASIKKHKAEWLTIFGVKDETESDNGK